MLFYNKPNDMDPKWKVRRGIAVGCFRLMLLGFLWILALVTYSIIMDKKLDGLSSATTIISFFITCFSGVIGKYMHDASNENKKDK